MTAGRSRGYLTEHAATERTGPGAGRPAAPLSVCPDREFFVGVKLTGDELIGVVCDLTARVRAVAHHRLASSEVGAHHGRALVRRRGRGGLVRPGHRRIRHRLRAGRQRAAGRRRPRGGARTVTARPGLSLDEAVALARGGDPGVTGRCSPGPARPSGSASRRSPTWSVPAGSSCPARGWPPTTSTATDPGKVTKDPSAARRAGAMAAAAQAAAAGIADTPLLGWSSWSMESTTRPGFNPDGGGSWLTEANLFKQVDAVAKTLKPSGYQYVNIDAGWSRDITGGGWDALHFDANGREIASPQRFPDGMKPVADYIHGKGLKEGRHLPRGRHRHPGVRRWSNRDRRRSRLHDRRHRLPGPADDQRRSRRRRSTPVTT